MSSFWMPGNPPPPGVEDDGVDPLEFGGGTSAPPPVSLDQLKDQFPCRMDSPQPVHQHQLARTSEGRSRTTRSRSRSRRRLSRSPRRSRSSRRSLSPRKSSSRRSNSPRRSSRRSRSPKRSSRRSRSPRTSSRRSHSPRRSSVRSRSPSHRSRRSRSRSRNRDGRPRPHRRSRSRSRSPARRQPDDDYAAAAPSRALPVGEEYMVVLREMINGNCGVVEFFEDGVSGLSRKSGFFHADAVCVENPSGNPYGPAVPLRSVGKPLLNYATPASEWKVRAVDVPAGGAPCFDRVVVAMWPKTTEGPDDLPEAELLVRQFQHFQSNIDYSALVHTSVHVIDYAANGRAVDADARVYEVRGNHSGIIEIRYSEPEAIFKVLFHKEDVFLKDGKRAIEHEFFKDKSLREIVKNRQPVNVSARSVVISKGSDLKPCALELQAVCVSLDQTQLPKTAYGPTYCPIGRGLYGKSPRYTPIYFQEFLMDRLNQKLADFLFSSSVIYPQIDQTLLANVATNVGNHPALATPASGGVQEQDLFPQLAAGNAVVKELLSDSSGILENMSKTWMCFFTSSRTLLPRGMTMAQAMKPGTKVQVNATLIDGKNQIQYLASCVWDKKNFPDQARQGFVNNVDQQLLQKYYDVNELFAMDNGSAMKGAVGVPIGAAGKSPWELEAQQQASFPPVYEGQPGIVYKLLDENFGLIRFSNSLALFDTCDFWTRPSITAAKEGRQLQDVVQVDTKVKFHATLLRPNEKIQYLASSIWLANDHRFDDPSLTPKPLRREKIHVDKINIYEMVLKSVSPSLPDLRTSSVVGAAPLGPPVPVPAVAGPPASMVSSDPDKDVLLDTLGLVTVIFMNEASSVMGGIIEFDLTQQCFFSVSSCKMDPFKVQGIRAGCHVKLNMKRARGLPWASMVSFVALTVYDKEVFMPEDQSRMQEKFLKGVAVLEEIIKATGKDFFLQLHPPKQSVVKMGTHKLEKYTGQGRFASLLTTECGVLEDIKHRGRFIYFELSDLNFAKPLPVTDLVPLLKFSGVVIKYTATRMVDCVLAFAALSKGVEVSGRLPVTLSSSMPRFDIMPFEQVATTLDAGRLKRFQDANLLFKEGQTLSLQKAQMMVFGPLKPIVKLEGKVRLILNENFALVYGPTASPRRSYCLFDTYDLMIANGVSAADRSLDISSIVKVGDNVLYNACPIEEEHVISYLATAVWYAGNVQDIAALTRNELQPQKIQIYYQVINSCEGLVLKNAKEEEEKVETMEASIMAKRAAIQETIATKGYNHPSSAGGSSSAGGGARPLKQPSQQNSATSSTTNPPESNTKVKIDLFDKKTTGKLLQEKGENFAILELNTGDKCLLASHRLWINDKPKFGNWRVLHLSYFKTVNICARRVKGYPDFAFQAIFGHAGIHSRDFTTNEFNYPINMDTWVNSKHNEVALDKELGLYKAMVGK